MLLVWLLLILEWFRRLWLRVWVMRFSWLVFLVLDGKEVDSTGTTSAHLAGLLLQSRPRVWKRLCHVEHSFDSIPDRKRRRNDQDDGGYVPAQNRTGVSTGPRLQVCTILISRRLSAFLGCGDHTHTLNRDQNNNNNNNNNNNTIWRGSVLTGEEPPPHSGELKRALAQAGGPTQSQLSRPVSSRHHISVEHRLRGETVKL